MIILAPETDPPTFVSHAIPLGFAQIQCQRCSAIRIRGITCPDCGAAPAPWEVDPQRQRRQRTVTAVLRRFDDTPSPTPPSTVDLTELGAFAQTARWLEQFFLALQAAVGPSGDGESLHEAVAEFVRLRAEIDGMPRLRPWLRLVDAAQAVIPALEDAARGFLSALAAETPLEAQRAASRAQGWLDSATDLLQDYLGHLARWQRASEGSDLDELLLGLVRESRQVVGEPDLLQFDAAGAADFYNLTGEQCPSGFGVALQMLRLVAEGIGDADRFGRVLADAYRHLMAHPERLDRLVSNPTFKSDLSDALIKSIDTSQSAEILLAAALHPRQHVAVLLDTAHGLFEGPGKRHAAALISVAKGKPYDRLRQADASAILRQADQAGFGQMLNGLDPAVRGARAHLSWALDGGRRRSDHWASGS